MLETPEQTEGSGSTEAEADRPLTAARHRVALGLAIIALVAALVGAVGPAERVRTTYSWPPKTLPTGTPAQLWYSPLLLVAHRPEAITANIPCKLPPPLVATSKPATVLATARHPQQNGGLLVSETGDQVTISVGEDVLQRLRSPLRPTDSDCAYRLRLAGDQWSIGGGPRGIAHGGALETMPRVYGLFSGLDLRTSSPPSIDVTTTSHATRATGHQTAAWIIAAVALAIALLLVGIERTPSRPRLVTARLVRRATANAHPVDAFVAVVLLGWWVLAPIAFDDGWVVAREQMFSSSGGFSLYYTTLGANLPLDYWLEWAHHWLAETTSALIFLRIPTLLCLATMWVLCRWITGRVTSSLGGPEPIVLWALTCAFLVGALAWGMTLRPEPVTALLFITVTACMVRFLEYETAASVAAAAVFFVLALSAHTTGVVSLAAVLIAAPKLFSWARRRITAAATIVAAAGALLVVLVFVGSDIEQRRLDVQLSKTYSSPFRDEFSRYAFLNGEPWGAPIRRIAVGLIMLAVLAYVLRLRRDRAGLLDFPTSVLAVAAVLLATTPSKWPWHFGALIGVGAVAVASETARLRFEAARSSEWQPWPFFAIAAAAAVGYWSWWESHSWNPVDLRTLTWYGGLAHAFSILAILVPTYLVLASLVIARIGGRGSTLHAVPWRVASWTAPLLIAPAIVYTVGILIVDTSKADSWTLARQNLETIVGNQGCGIADDLVEPVASSARPLPAFGIGSAPPVPPWVPSPPVARLPRFALSPVARQSSHSPWFEIGKARRLGLFVAGIPGPADHLSFDWGRNTRGRVETLRSDKFTRTIRELPGTTPWRFFTAGELPRPDPDASVVRVSFRSGVAPGSAVAVTPPVVYRNEQLSMRMSRDASRSLVYPELLPYFPCARLPRLRDGTVEVPQSVVLTDSLVPRERTLAISDNALDVVLQSSPFRGLQDIYQWERLSLADTKDWPDRVLAFRVDQSIPGATLAVPDRLTVTS